MYFAYVVGDSDPKKDQGLFKPCYSVCEEWFQQKYAKMQKYFRTRKSAKDGSIIYVARTG